MPVSVSKFNSSYRIAAALGSFFEFKEAFEGELSSIARQGSGSACRSMFGGFVAWEMGENEDGSDSIAVPIAAEDHWEELCAVIVVASSAKKAVGSTEGMQRTVLSSPLMKERIDIVPARMEAMEAAIKTKDFPAFAEITMKDSNQFHAVCVDSYPPIFYLNDTSKKVIELVHSINDIEGMAIAAYTFDAGPNAVVFTLKSRLGFLIEKLVEAFPVFFQSNAVKDPLRLLQPMKMKAIETSTSTKEIDNIIISAVGRGPQITRL